MSTIKTLSTFFIFIFISIVITKAQPHKEINCRTESGSWEINCVDEYLEGDITFCVTRWLFKSQNRITLKQKASLRGTESDDIYTISSFEKLRFRELKDGSVYVKSGISTVSIYRNGEFWSIAHINRHLTYNAKGEMVVYVDHQIECD
jgi:hypothetical protein